MANVETRAGMVAIVGLPNVGKSSLLNRFLGTKLAIVTPRAQTTRQRIVGIDTREGVQTIFLDTPGIVDPAYLLHRSMLEVFREAVGDADVVVLLLDGTRPAPDFDEEIEQMLRSLPQLVVAINKTDMASRDSLEGLESWARDRFGTEPMPISATTGEGVEELRAEIARRLPQSPFLYPEDDISTQNLRFFVEELIRETIFELYRDEIPYSTTVRVEEFRENVEPIYIRATVFVERASQKGILLGRGGGAVRELGRISRAKIEAFLDQRVYLDLWVKILPKWRKDPVALARFGFPLPPDRTE